MVYETNIYQGDKMSTQLAGSEIRILIEALDLLLLCENMDIFIDMADELYKEGNMSDYVKAHSYSETIEKFEKFVHAHSQEVKVDHN